MFNFFKKKTQPNVTQKVQPIEVLNEVEIAAINAEIAEKTTQLTEKLSESNIDKPLIAHLYEQMGLTIAKLDKDKAMNYLESSLSYQLSIGDGYKLLMNLYNQKRAEAARNGDGEGIDKWMNKMDDMRQIAKQVIITG